MFKRNTDCRVWPYKEYPQLFLPDETHEIITSDKRYVRDWKKSGPSILYDKSPHAIALCRLVGQPVFWIADQHYANPKLSKWEDRQKHYITIGKDVPRLCEIRNFAKFYPANEIYQDLSYVLGNLMHDPPDANPPVQVGEAVRWVKKGFDSKTSFRGK